MVKTLKLYNPILINNTMVDSLTYDENEITGALFAEAEAEKKTAGGVKNFGINLSFEFDTAFHLFIGMAAIIAVNPHISFDDLERLKGADVVKVTSIGRNFIMKPEESAPDNTEAPSETTQKPTTRASETSKKSE